MSVNIVEFLEARIAEDEAVGRDVATSFAQVDAARAKHGWSPLPDAWNIEAGSDGDPLVSIGPSRVLAECAAKRAIVGLHGKSCDYASEYRKPTPLIVCLECGPHEDVDWRTNGSGNFPCPTLRHLAAVYDQHPDYDPAWRP